MRQQAENSAAFYISKTIELKDYTREKLVKVLLKNNILLP
jgi:hypothetical protein